MHVDNGMVAEDSYNELSFYGVNSVWSIHSQSCLSVQLDLGEFLLKILKSAQYKRITSLPLYISCQVLDKMCSTIVDMKSW